jgi:hypothetical protein
MAIIKVAAIRRTVVRSAMQSTLGPERRCRSLRGAQEVNSAENDG